MTPALPATSRAAVFRTVRAPLTLERFPVRCLEEGEVLVRTLCATICGSDLHSWAGRRPAPVPSVLGHEMVGEIVGMGGGGARDYRGQPLELGERVTWSMVWSCGECFYCRNGLRPKCERLMKFGHERLAPGRELLGGLAEHCLLPEKTAIFQAPDGVPDPVLSPANCATATVMAVCRQAGPITGQTVVVHGAGMLGLTACAVAATAGAAQVLVVEPDAPRREQAARFGASEVWDARRPAAELRMRVLELTQGRGADLALEFSGQPEAFRNGLDVLRAGGRFVLAGATFPGAPAPTPVEQIVRQMLRIVGVYNYRPEDLDAALEFLARNHTRFPFADLVERTFSLDAVSDAFAYAEQERPPRVAVRP
jgi:alcohol dehydrogenase